MMQQRPLTKSTVLEEKGIELLGLHIIMAMFKNPRAEESVFPKIGTLVKMSAFSTFNQNSPETLVRIIRQEKEFRGRQRGREEI